MRLIIVVLLCIDFTAFAQKVKDQLQGDWVCIKIIDSKGRNSTGKYGYSTEYLRFSFIKNKVRISESPFDIGASLDFSFDRKSNLLEITQNKILKDVESYFPLELPERFYTIKKIDDKSLILSAKNSQNEFIEYTFANQKEFVKKGITNSLHAGPILIKHVNLSYGHTSIGNKLGEYFITNDTVNLLPSPILFKSKNSIPFASVFSNTFKLQDDFTAEKLSNEIVVKFVLTVGGAIAFSIEKGNDPDLEKEVLRVMKVLSKNWELNSNYSDVREVGLTLQFYFVKTNDKFLIPFKK